MYKVSQAFAKGIHQDKDFESQPDQGSQGKTWLRLFSLSSSLLVTQPGQE